MALKYISVAMMNTPPDIFVLSNGDSRDPFHFGGTPATTIRLLADSGLQVRGASLYPKLPAAIVRATHNFAAMMIRRSFGGSQYSQLADRVRSKRAHTLPRPNVGYVHMFQLPPRNLPLERAVFYLDSILEVLWSDYGLCSHLSKSERNAILERQRENFQACRGFVMRSERMANYLVDLYDVNPDRVSVALPPPNLDLEYIESRLTAESDNADGPFKLLVVGRDFYRKGLDDLINALDTGSISVPFKLIVAGLRPNDIPVAFRRPYMTALGHVSSGPPNFKLERLLLSASAGAMLSRAEMGGIASLEFKACGVPVLWRDVGGISEFADGTINQRVSAEASVDELAQALQMVASAPPVSVASRIESLRSIQKLRTACSVTLLQSLDAIPTTPPHGR